jgi:hypothetical protein
MKISFLTGLSCRLNPACSWCVGVTVGNGQHGAAVKGTLQIEITQISAHCTELPLWHYVVIFVFSGVILRST